MARTNSEILALCRRAVAQQGWSEEDVMPMFLRVKRLIREQEAERQLREHG